MKCHTEALQIGKSIDRRKRGYANDGTQQLHEMTLDQSE